MGSGGVVVCGETCLDCGHDLYLRLTHRLPYLPLLLLPGFHCAQLGWRPAALCRTHFHQLVLNFDPQIFLGMALPLHCHRLLPLSGFQHHLHQKPHHLGRFDRAVQQRFPQAELLDQLWECGNNRDEFH